MFYQLSFENDKGRRVIKVANPFFGFYEGKDLNGPLGLEVQQVILSKEDYENLEASKIEIKLGVDQNGFDTTQVSEEDQEMLEMRSYPQSHRACWGMYLSAGGGAYRCYASSRELKEMVAQYEYKQSLLERMKREGFREFPESFKMEQIYQELDKPETESFEMNLEPLESEDELASEDEIIRHVIENQEHFENYGTVDGNANTITFLPPHLRTSEPIEPGQLIVGDDRELYRVKERFSMHDYLPGMGPAVEHLLEHAREEGEHVWNIGVTHDGETVYLDQPHEWTPELLKTDTIVVSKTGRSYIVRGMIGACDYSSIGNDNIAIHYSLEKYGLDPVPEEVESQVTINKITKEDGNLVNPKWEDGEVSDEADEDLDGEEIDYPEDVECEKCGRVWDGNAQCFPCPGDYTDAEEECHGCKKGAVPSHEHLLDDGQLHPNCRSYY